MRTNTRKTDEELIINFVKDQGRDNSLLMSAIRRLEDGLSKGLSDYSVQSTTIQSSAAATKSTHIIPCDIPCPKCGSTDICREFFKKGTFIKNTVYDVAPFDRWTTGQCHSFSALRDLLKNHCRSCQHVWPTKPLNTKQYRELIS